METNSTPKIIKGITQDMLVKLYKPIGTGENSEVFAGTIAGLKEALGVGPSSGVTRSVFQFSIGEATSTLLNQINKLGGTISLTNDAAFAFTLTRTGGDPLTGQVIGMFVPGLIEDEGQLPIVYTTSDVIEIGTAISFKFPDGTAIPNTSGIKATLIVDYYPNGWDS